MPLSKGDHLGPYEILEPIGKGGMGEVFKAHDPRLRRDVAIKISAEKFNERFEREARAVAALNHPNICQIYDVGPNYLVMEYIEGPTLGERIKEGALPLEEALPLATQIAAALDAAHERTITHRDLKPGNIKVKPDGVVKVLDFGLAKFGGAPAGPQNSEESPTLSMAATKAGVILGTPGYMAPEQVKGKDVDKRADVWAFGVVLYEMVTGHKLFKGEDVVDILAAVVNGQPDLSVVPQRVRRLITRCLEKDPRKRLRDMNSVALLLEDGDATEALTAAPTQTITVTTAAPRSTAVPLWAWAVMGALAIAAALSAFFAMRSNPTPASFAASLTMDLAPAILGPVVQSGRPSRTAMAISPDGATVVFTGDVLKESARTTMLYRRPLSESQASVIAGTENAEYPFFSPDGQWVGFAAGNKLKKVALSGGPPIDLCDLTSRINGASWGSGGVIAFARGGLWTVSNSSGKPEAPFKYDPNSTVYSPAMLPDGKTVLFTELASVKWEEAHVDAIDLSTKQRKTLIPNATDARYSPTGHLVFMRDTALLAVPFDAARVEVTGDAVPLLAGIMQSTNAANSGNETGMGQFALSASGTLVYAPGGRFPNGASTLVRVDRKGAETKLAEIKGALYGLRVSPDGSRVVALKTQDGTRASDIWIYELPSGTGTPLTSTGEADWPLFSPDGKSVLFEDGGKSPGTYSLKLDGSNAPQRVIEDKPGLGTLVASWSADGKWLAYLQAVANRAQIFVRPVQDSKLDSGEPRQFSPSTFAQRDAHFSPDGRWIAYATNESGASEVYVQPFPGPGEKHRISTKGGGNPAWSRNSRELFYFGAGNGNLRQMMAVNLSATGAPASEPRVLFEGPYTTSTPVRSYDVTPDGQFIMMRRQEAPDERVTKLNVVLGWAEDLKRRVPTR